MINPFFSIRYGDFVTISLKDYNNLRDFHKKGIKIITKLTTNREKRIYHTDEYLLDLAISNIEYAEAKIEQEKNDANNTVKEPEQKWYQIFTNIKKI